MISLLSDRMLDKMSNASRLVDKILSKGLATRSLCENDRRAVDVVLTTKGINVLEQIDQLQNRWEENLKEKISDEEAKILNLILDKLR
jgi:DNA-binding MarR family transcriptional regulator